ncbi:DUF2271 domain-containing protein [Sphingomonas sp. BIUV-7]|uniref:DUF2271 domain-containing protein n=1 Tax=Sphingomonas natans TaxID=3063330 RepID=A0ABT8YD71_9SPHN|nr:DUF2271 domain-containing protein [Sphingomonas sp. BIUV-7]MDO6416275.1 DUF2271 domain-containing protein [Sphingomonas sp. BIUV-7]
MRPNPLRTASFALVGGLSASAATAGTVSVTLPRLAIAEYHKPYVAGWVEPAGGGTVRSLFAWYDIKKGGAEPGHKWLADLRSWWRKSGRSLKLPVDGVSGATKGPGTYTISLPNDLAPGAYVLNVEAAREGGGRELVSVPITVPNGSGKASGKTELGAVTVAAK